MLQKALSNLELDVDEVVLEKKNFLNAFHSMHFQCLASLTTLKLDSPFVDEDVFTYLLHYLRFESHQYIFMAYIYKAIFIFDFGGIEFLNKIFLEEMFVEFLYRAKKLMFYIVEEYFPLFNLESFFSESRVKYIAGYGIKKFVGVPTFFFDASSEEVRILRKTALGQQLARMKGASWHRPWFYFYMIDQLNLQIRLVYKNLTSKNFWLAFKGDVWSKYKKTLKYFSRWRKWKIFQRWWFLRIFKFKWKFFLRGRYWREKKKLKYKKKNQARQRILVLLIKKVKTNYFLVLSTTTGRILYRASMGEWVVFTNKRRIKMDASRLTTIYAKDVKPILRRRKCNKILFIYDGARWNRGLKTLVKYIKGGWGIDFIARLWRWRLPHSFGLRKKKLRRL